MQNKYIVDSQTIIYASKEPNGEISRWLKKTKPFVTNISYYECLINWKEIDNPRFLKEKMFLENFFSMAKVEDCYIESTKDNLILTRGKELNQNYNLAKHDALIAATSEIFSYILITGDNRKNFAPRLEKLNLHGRGNFKVLSYQYKFREEFFNKLNQIAKKNIE